MTALRGTKISYNKPKLYKSLGALIKDYRQWRGVSQEYIAGLIGVSVRQFRNWEANRRRTRIENLHDISEVTGIPMQVCVALNADQPLWYCIEKRWFAYSPVVARSLPNEVLKSSEILGEDLALKIESITTDKHFNMVLSCHRDIYHATKPLRRDTIEKASAIIPDLNYIILDSWGHYVGHSIWLPIGMDVYSQLKKQKSFESYLTPERVSEITSLNRGVYLFISFYISSLNVAYFNLIKNSQHLAKLSNKEKYTISMYSAMPETHEVSNAMGLRVVRSDKYGRSEGYNKLYEARLDLMMKLSGPWNWPLKDYKLKVKNNFSGIPKPEKLPSVKSNISIKIPDTSRKHSLKKKSGAVINDNNLVAPIVDNSIRFHQRLADNERLEGIKIQTDKDNGLDKTACPNTNCALYGKKGKENIVSNGTYRRKGEKAGHRFLCKKCGKSFCNRTGTMFYDLRSSEEDVLKALKLLAEGKSLYYVKNNLGVKFSTLRRWMIIASEQITRKNNLLKNNLNISEPEVNSLLTDVENLIGMH